MNYIYDIVLNFQRDYCNFYEWRLKDKVDNIRKIPLYKVSSEDIYSFMFNEIVVDDEFLEKLKNDIGNSKRLMCLVSDGNIGIGLLFNGNGNIIKKSSMIYEEEDEVCEYVLELECSSINFLVNKKKSKNLELRFCRERRKFLLKFLNKIDNDMLWQYLYYDCYCDEVIDIEKIKKSLYEVVDNVYSEINNKLYNSVCKFSKILN